MLSHKKSLNILKKTDALLDGHFVLSSGLHSPKYIQCAKLLSYPYIAKEICKSLTQKINIRRGFKIKKGSKVLIIEDVITTGKSSLECVNLIKKSQAKLIGFACIIDRSNKKNLKIKQKIVSQMKINVPTFTKNQLPTSLKSIPVSKPGSRYI